MRIRLNRSEVFIARCQFSFPILPFVYTRYRQSNVNWPPRFKNMNESEGQKENIKCTLAQVSFEQCTVFSNANSFCVRLLNEKKTYIFFFFLSFPFLFSSYYISFTLWCHMDGLSCADYVQSTWSIVVVKCSTAGKYWKLQHYLFITVPVDRLRSVDWCILPRTPLVARRT